VSKWTVESMFKKKMNQWVELIDQKSQRKKIKLISKIIKIINQYLLLKQNYDLWKKF